MSNRKKLGELLVAAGVLDETRLQAALSEQKKWGGKLGRVLIDLGFVKEQLMVKALSHQLQLPAVDLQRDLPTSEAISRVPVQLAEKYGIFPMAFDDHKKSLSVATSDPTNENSLRDLRMELNLRNVSPVVAGAVDIDRAIRQYYYGERIDSVSTATPSHFGLSEQLIDLGVPSAGVIPGRDASMTHMVDAASISEEVTAPQPVAVPRPQAAPPSNGAARLPPPLAQPLVPGLPQKPPTLAPQAAQPPSKVMTAAAMVAQQPAQPTADLAALSASVHRLEQLLSAEVRSLRTMVEMLVEKGVLNREEYLKRVKERH